MAVLTECVFVVWGNYANAQPLPTTKKVIYPFIPETSIVALQTYNPAENGYTIEDYRIHSIVFGLEAEVSFFLVEALDGSFLAVDESDDDVAVFGIVSPFDYNDVAVEDTCVYHTFAADSESEEVSRIVVIGLEADIAGDVLNRGDRLTGGYCTQNGYGSSRAVWQTESTVEVIGLFEQTVVHEHFDIAVSGRCRVEVHSVHYLADRGRSALIEPASDIVEDLYFLILS